MTLIHLAQLWPLGQLSDILLLYGSIWRQAFMNRSQNDFNNCMHGFLLVVNTVIMHVFLTWAPTWWWRVKFNLWCNVKFDITHVYLQIAWPIHLDCHSDSNKTDIAYFALEILRPRSSFASPCMDLIIHSCPISPDKTLLDWALRTFRPPVFYHHCYHSFHIQDRSGRNLVFSCILFSQSFICILHV